MVYKHEKNEKHEQKEQYIEPTRNNKIILFIMPGCPYCVQFDPVFSEVMSEYTRHDKSNKEWVVTKESDTKEARIKYNITSFPSMVIMRDGNVVEVKTGSMNKSAFKLFLSKYIKPEDYIVIEEENIIR